MNIFHYQEKSTGNIFCKYNSSINADKKMRKHVIFCFYYSSNLIA